MDTIRQSLDEVQVRLTHDEVIAITNALNESLENLEEWDFGTRMGVTKSEAAVLLTAFRQIKTN
jgi:hypothetical protein